MSQQDNPYRAPDTGTAAADKSVSNDELIRRGRLIFFGIVSFLILSNIILPLAMGYDLKVHRLVVIGFLLFVTWRGYGWGRVVLGLFIAWFVPFLALSTVGFLMLADSLLTSVNLMILGGEIFLLFALFLSKSLKAYCKRKSSTAVNISVREDPLDLPENPTGKELFTVATFDHRAMADVCRVAIEQEGIAVFIADDHLVGGVNFLLSNAVRGIKVQVTDTDARRAMEIWHRTKPAAETNEFGNDTPVEFDCEECGKFLSFPGRRRGYVETCPHCGEYVDVPERE